MIINKNSKFALVGHGPHRDTWFGHTFNALNLWWSISNVSERTGVILYNQTNNYKLQHEKNPAYIKKNKHYTGKPKVISMKDGELLVFDPEILHASRIITNDRTRIVFSARINENKPKFYKKSGEVEFPYWLRSDDIKNNTCNKIHTFYKKNNFANPDQKKDFKIAKFEKKIIKEKIKFGKKYKISSGIHSVSTDTLKAIEYIKKDFNMIAYSLDSLFIRECALSGLKKIKSYIKNK